jgi:hypothetical protein
MKIYCNKCKFYYNFCEPILGDYCNAKAIKDMTKIKENYEEKEYYSYSYYTPSELNKNNDCQYFKQRHWWN